MRDGLSSILQDKPQNDVVTDRQKCYSQPQRQGLLDTESKNSCSEPIYIHENVTSRDLSNSEIQSSTCIHPFRFSTFVQSLSAAFDVVAAFVCNPS